MNNLKEAAETMERAIKELPEEINTRFITKAWSELKTAISHPTAQAGKEVAVERIAKPFRDQLAEVINKNSREKVSNTPDFILASFLEDCLRAFETASRRREAWYGVAHSVKGQKTIP